MHSPTQGERLTGGWRRNLGTARFMADKHIPTPERAARRFKIARPRAGQAIALRLRLVPGGMVPVANDRQGLKPDLGCAAPREIHAQTFSTHWPGTKARSAAGPRLTSPREGALSRRHKEKAFQANARDKSRPPSRCSAHPRSGAALWCAPVVWRTRAHSKPSPCGVPKTILKSKQPPRQSHRLETRPHPQGTRQKEKMALAVSKKHIATCGVAPPSGHTPGRCVSRLARLSPAAVARSCLPSVWGQARSGR